jgi:hypothetical protein
LARAQTTSLRLAIVTTLPAEFVRRRVPGEVSVSPVPRPGSTQSTEAHAESMKANFVSALRGRR